MSNSCVVLVVLMGRLALGQTANYAEREVVFQNGSVELHGTLVIPTLQIPAPAIVFLHGSGSHARGGFRPYAEEFAKMGIAGLIFDKRGSGNSGGSWITASIEDLANDALAAIEFLKTVDEIDNKRIGFWGISQAGWVAPMAAARSPDVSFMIIVSGGGASPRESEMYSYHQSFIRGKLSPEEASLATELVDSYMNYLDSGIGREQLKERLGKIPKDRLNGLGPHLEGILPTEANRRNWRWVASNKPEADLQQTTCPLLVLLGEQDSNHPTGLATRQWKMQLEAARNDSVTIVVFRGAGHGIRQRVGLSGPGRAPFADGYLEIQIGWLWRHVIHAD